MKYLLRTFSLMHVPDRKTDYKL